MKKLILQYPLEYYHHIDLFLNLYKRLLALLYFGFILTEPNVKASDLNSIFAACHPNNLSWTAFELRHVSISKWKYPPPFSLVQGRWRTTHVDGAHDVVQTPSGTAEVLWLQDLLPSLIPNARIATYSYESDWRKGNIKTNLRICGKQLLNSIRHLPLPDNVSFVYLTRSAPRQSVPSIHSETQLERSLTRTLSAFRRNIQRRSDEE